MFGHLIATLEPLVSEFRYALHHGCAGLEELAALRPLSLERTLAGQQVVAQALQPRTLVRLGLRLFVVSITLRKACSCSW